MMGQQKKLSIAFYWHMHQPVYQLNTNGDYLMPWVRLHAVKDYLDMILWAKKIDKLKLNFNFVPVLLDSIIDYSQNNAFDIHSRLTVTPENSLTREDKIFILNNFFDANYQHMILAFDRYHKLYQKLQQVGRNNIEAFSNQEYSDILALFNLAWTDPTFIKTNKELKALVKKGKNYTLEDRIQIINIHTDIIKKIIPTIKKLLEKNKIEITTSPYYHPILPILLDYKNICNQNSDLANLNTELDAKLQTKMALDRVEEIFGQRPRGVWTSEHCVSSKTLSMLSSLGVDWSISDEKILSSSIDYEFVHDFKGYLKEPYHLLKTYEYKSGLKMIFRDSSVHNLISFEYPSHESINCANDLYDRIKVIQSKILSSPDKNHLLTIALDGENCWENYEKDGGVFLETLYNLITNDETLETVLISEYVDKISEHKPLQKIAEGSWFSKDFNLWVNEPVKDLAWIYLKRVRDDFSEFVKREPSNPNISLAQKELFICEGSDWFWWYGEPNDSGRDNIFDFIFRTHLKNVYRYLNLDIPKYLDIPIIDSEHLTTSKEPLKPLITPPIDGLEIQSKTNEWNNSGYIEIPDGPVLRESKLFEKIRYGYDEDNFYLKFHLNKFIKGNIDFSRRTYQIYLYTRKYNGSQDLSPVRLINKTANILPISVEKFHNEIQIALNNDNFQYVRLIKAIADNLWVCENSKNIISAYNETLDLKIPFEAIDIKNGETLEFMFVTASFGIKDFSIPDETLLSVTRPLAILKN